MPRGKIERGNLFPTPMSRVVVTIHGTGRTVRDFWIPQRQALAEALGVVPQHHSVWWGDMIDVGACISESGQWTNARLHSLSQLLRGRPAGRTTDLVSGIADGLHRITDSVAGVVAYFVPSGKQEVIRERLRQTLAKLTAQKHEIVLVSESLGCLIAFDVLYHEARQYNIAAWFTLGCPLRTLVMTGQRPAELGAINRQTVRQWFNLYGAHDLIASPIASVFPDYPIRDEKIETPRGGLEAHRYWSNPRVPALIARALRGSGPAD